MLGKNQYLEAFKAMYLAHSLIRKVNSQSGNNTTAAAKTSIEDLFEKENAQIIAATLELYRNVIPQAGFVADELYAFDSTLRQKSTNVTEKDLNKYPGLVPSFASRDELTQLYGDLRLTKREADIVGHLLCRSSDKQIARDLKIKYTTVRTHMSRLFKKLDVEDRVELVLHIFEYLRNPNT